MGTRRPGGPGPDHAVGRAGHLAGRLWRGRFALAVVGGDVLPCRRQRPACLKLDVQTLQPGPDRIESRGGQTQQSWETEKAKEEKRPSSIWAHQIKTWTLVKNNNGDNSFVDTVMGGRRPGVCVLILMTVGEVLIQSSLPGLVGEFDLLRTSLLSFTISFKKSCISLNGGGGSCLTRCSLLAEVITASDRRCMLTGCSGIILTHAS